MPANVCRTVVTSSTVCEVVTVTPVREKVAVSTVEVSVPFVSVEAIASNVDQLILRQYVVVYAFQKHEDGNVPQDKIDSAVKRFPRMYAMLDAGVGDGYLGGDSFTMADCFLMPILFSAQNFPEGKSFLEQSPALKAYYDRIARRPSFIETAA